MDKQKFALINNGKTALDWDQVLNFNNAECILEDSKSNAAKPKKLKTKVNCVVNL